MDSIRHFLSTPAQPSRGYVIAVTALSTLTALSILRYSVQRVPPALIHSPKKSLLPQLSAEEISSLAYPPDALPGGRDVESAYGTIRVYEWGPEDGKKVLLVHGITTPCLVLGGLAHGLVDRGCRVMLIDLWGRGYSDSPADLPHDVRLYSTEILLALASSPLAWTGPNTFSLIGYSLGGGISANFAGFFPQLVDALVLLAPAGLIRPNRMSGQNRLIYSTGLLPEKWLQWSVRRRLQQPMFRNGKPVGETEGEQEEAKERKVGTSTAVSAEVAGAARGNAPSTPLSRKYPNLAINAAVQWQLREHLGFVDSFISSVRHAPIAGHQADWTRLQNRKDKPLVFAGTQDPIIHVDELEQDIDTALGLQRVEFIRIAGGAHDFPMTDLEQVLGKIADVWELKE